MSSLPDLRSLLVDQLRDLLHAEKQLLKALPKMARAAAAPALREAFSNHLAETREHVARLTHALTALAQAPRGKTCHAMKGLIKEGSEALEASSPEEVRDAHLIAAAQRVEHYEMAAYGTARAFALTLGCDEVAGLLDETLQEEGKANAKLNAIARTVNQAAIRAA